MPGLIVTATGTDVGKTYVTAGLLRAARRAGLTVDALKPILSGADPSDLADSDAGRLLAALDRPLTPATLGAMSPWRYAAPLSPDMAARREGRTVPFDAVVEACHTTAAAAKDLVLIEGVGGVMVPLDAHRTTLDLMAALRLPLVLVGATHLGAISHGLTAMAALRTRGLLPCLIVLSESADGSAPAGETRDTIAAFAEGIDVILLPRDPPDAAFDRLLASLLASLDRIAALEGRVDARRDARRSSRRPRTEA